MNRRPFNHTRKPNGTLGHDIMSRQAATVRAQASAIDSRAHKYRAHQRQFSLIGYVSWGAVLTLGIFGISWLPLILWGFIYFFDIRQDLQLFNAEQTQVEAEAINLHKQANRIDPNI